MGPGSRCANPPNRLFFKTDCEVGGVVPEIHFLRAKRGDGPNRFYHQKRKNRRFLHDSPLRT